MNRRGPALVFRDEFSALTNPLQQKAQKARAKISNALQRGKPKMALSGARALLRLKGCTLDDCLQVQDLGERLLDVDLAIEAAARAAEIAPSNLGLFFKLSDVQLRNGFTKDAIETLSRAEGLCASAGDFDDLGNRLNLAGADRDAYDSFKRANELEPENAHYISNLAIIKAYWNEVDEAEALYDKLLSIVGPDDAALMRRSYLRKQTAQNNHIEELQAALGSLPEDRQPWVLYALAKEHEDLGRQDEAFGFVRRAAETQRKHLSYSISSEVIKVRNRRQTFNEAFFSDVSEGDPATDPIFIVSLPRAGSTLVEQMLAGHSQIESADELQDFNRVTRVKSNEATRRLGLDRQWSGSDISKAMDMKGLGEAYVQSVRSRVGASPHFIDKLPLNFLNCGLIAAALPNATILHVHRHPVDACYSMYKAPFSEGYFFSYALEELAEYYLAYRDLMQHWEEVMPGRIINVAYEDVVSDARASIEPVLQRIGLDWEEGCLKHTESSAVSKTASSTQVRQPVYASSVGRWRQYSEELEPLIKRLEQGGVDVA